MKRLIVKCQNNNGNAFGNLFINESINVPKSKETSYKKNKHKVTLSKKYKAENNPGIEMQNLSVDENLALIKEIIGNDTIYLNELYKNYPYSGENNKNKKDYQKLKKLWDNLEGDAKLKELFK